MWTKIPQTEETKPSTIKQSLVGVTLPVFTALMMAMVVFWTGEQILTPTVVEEERLDQLPVTRTLVVPIRTVNGQNYLATVNGRQIKNYEKNKGCEYTWMGEIHSIAAKAGTITIAGQYHIDDAVEASEYGFEGIVKHELEGIQLKTENCLFGIISVDLEAQ